MSWQTMLKSELPDTMFVATDDMKDRIVQEVKEGKRKPRGVKTTLNRVVNFDWGATDFPEKMALEFVERAKEILNEIKNLGGYNIDTDKKMEEHALNELIPKYLQGDHEELESWVDGEGLKRSEKYARKGRFRTFLAYPTNKNTQTKIINYVKENNLQDTIVGKALKFKPVIQEEPRITEAEILNEKAVSFLKFIIHDNQFVGKERKELFPKTFENKPLESIAGRSTIRLLPALGYILDHEAFDMEKDDFSMDVSGQTQKSMALRKLRFNQWKARQRAGKDLKPSQQSEKGAEEILEREGMAETMATDVPKKLQTLFDKNVSVQFKSHPREGERAKEFGRARGLDKFLEAVNSDKDLKTTWSDWLNTFDVAGKYKISQDDYDALEAWNSIHNSTEDVEKEQKRQADKELKEHLPIGALTTVSKVKAFFRDSDKRDAFFNMKEIADGRRATPTSKPQLEELFYQSGKAKDLITSKYGGSTALESEEKLKNLSHLLQDEEYDSNRLRIEDVIELLREIEYEYKGGAKMNMVISRMRQTTLEDNESGSVWDKGIGILLKGVEDNYKDIRLSFIKAIKDVMVEESKKPDGPTVKWMEKEKVITYGE